MVWESRAAKKNIDMQSNARYTRFRPSLADRAPASLNSKNVVNLVTTEKDEAKNKNTPRRRFIAFHDEKYFQIYFVEALTVRV